VDLVTAAVAVGALAFVILTSEETTARLRSAASPEPRLAIGWEDRIAAVDGAIAAGDVSRATYAWREAYAMAIGSPGWEPLADLGDRALRLAALGGGSSAHYRDDARRLYRFALFRARSARSVDGLRRLADAFATLGHEDLAARVSGMADEVEARRDGA
jgi:hypothetical protein